MVIKKGKIAKFFKNFFLILFIFYLGVVIGYNFFYWLHKKTREIEIKKGEEAIRQFYLQDIYGGKTPQETVDLFISALKQKDIDLAVKYVSDLERKKIKEKLEEIKNQGRWDEFVNEISQVKYVPYPEESKWAENYYARFEFSTEKEVIIMLGLEKNKYNNLWKITHF